jgi:uncharacterized repeat protein (TIGR01451 family)
MVMKSKLGWAVVLGLVSACSAQSSERLGKNSAAASSGLTLTVQDPPATVYLGNPLYLWASFYSDGAVHNDVSLSAVITGDVEETDFQFYGYDPTWSCTQTVGKTITVNCHADSIQLKDGLSWQLKPRSEGVVSLDIHATEGGAEIASYHSDTSVVTASGADLGVYAYGGGSVPLGQQLYVPVNAYNNGPGSATDAVVTMSLSGPGKFVSAPSDKGAPPSPCTFTDTTATCAIGAMPAFAASTFPTVIQTTGVGTVSLTSTIAATEADPMSWNNTSVASFDVYKPIVADLSVAMTAQPDPAMFKKPMTYTIVVTNKGPDTATSPNLYDSFPSDLAFESVTTSQGSCYGGEYGYLSCTLGPIASGASATVKVVVTPSEGGTFTNYASVYNYNWLETDPDFANNSASTTTTVRGPNPPVAVTSKEQKVDTSFFAYAPCTNDFVYLSGSAHYGTHTFANDKSGRYRFESHGNTAGVTGTGYFTGIQYTSKSVTKSAQTYTGGMPASFDYADEYKLVADGAPDLTVHTLNHVTFAADGTPKVQVTKYSYECK